jgi:hypothetical protein
MAEQQIFDRAVRDFTARPGSNAPLAAIMRTAAEAASPGLRLLAERWLYRHCNVRFGSGEAQGNSDATPSTATNLC